MVQEFLQFQDYMFKVTNETSKYRGTSAIQTITSDISYARFSGTDREAYFETKTVSSSYRILNVSEMMFLRDFLSIDLITTDNILDDNSIEFKNDGKKRRLEDFFLEEECKIIRSKGFISREESEAILGMSEITGSDRNFFSVEGQCCSVMFNIMYSKLLSTSYMDSIMRFIGSEESDHKFQFFNMIDRGKHEAFLRAHFKDISPDDEKQVQGIITRSVNYGRIRA